MINNLLERGQRQFSTDMYFVDLRHNFSKILIPEGDNQYHDIDTADLLNVLRDIVRVYTSKSKPNVRPFENTGRKIAKEVQDFAKQLQEQCPPINQPSKSETFIDPDGYFTCREPIAKRPVVDSSEAGGPKDCPPFKGSRRTQFHVGYSGKGICREPIRTGEHHCPPNNGNPNATVHETLPGGVGICKAPFDVPQTLNVLDNIGGINRNMLPGSVATFPQNIIGLQSGGRNRRSLKNNKSRKYSKKLLGGGKKKSKKSKKKKSKKKKSKKKYKK